jgi:hypothetical protein
MKKIIFISFMAFVSCGNPKSNIQDLDTFSKTDWDNGNLRIRGDLANYLVESDTLSFMAKEQVLELLGKPDYQNDNSIKYTVDIGITSFLGSTLEHYLIINFSDSEVDTYLIID